MSCDYSVWNTTARLNSKEAGQLYARLCSGDTSGVAPHAGIAAFYAELTARHPEIDEIPEDKIDDTDLCPWSVAFDRSDGHIIMCCAWSKADYVGALVSQLARKHGLAFYDPQSEKIIYPNNAEKSAKPWWKPW
jgi:hypothetical protein